MAVDRNGLWILDRGECLELLGTRPVGRLAVTANALPAILPVSYCMMGDEVVFATGAGSKSLAVAQGQVIALEVDDIEPEASSGWSVLVVGVAEAVGRWHHDYEEVIQLPLRPWTGRHANHYMKLSTGHISGRRLSMPTSDVSANV